MSELAVCGRVSLQLEDGSTVMLYGPLCTLYVLIPDSLVLITNVEISFTEPSYEALTSALTTVALRSSSIVQSRRVKSLADYYCMLKSQSDASYICCRSYYRCILTV